MCTSVIRTKIKVYEQILDDSSVKQKQQRTLQLYILQVNVKKYILKKIQKK